MTSRKSILSIIAATSGVVFALFGSVMGTYAWFTAQANSQASVSMFQVANLSADISKVELIKFKYADDGIGGLDYLAPEDGTVEEYTYRSDVAQFGQGTYNEGTETWTSWTEVDVMNLYDPLQLVVAGKTLADLNCNAIFRVTMTSSMASAILTAIAIKTDPPQALVGTDILLSTCANFDFYVPSDLTGVPATYWPSYIDDKAEDEGTTPEAMMTDNEKLYYKISYLSANAGSHSHLYGNGSRTSVGQKTATFTAGTTTLYLNVNYASSQLKRYEETLSFGEIVRAIYDYYFVFE